MARTLYLIDAFAQIFRAYYAIRTPMNSPLTSEPTGAVFGFTSMLLKMLTVYRPDFVVVANDAPGPTFRHDLADDYKATRSATPEDLIKQVDRIFEVVNAFGLTTITRQGLEADDVIASVVHYVLNAPEMADVRVRIVSKDKDLAQLLGPRVEMFDIHTDHVVDEEALLGSRGVRPNQIIDFLTLTGDTSDNVRGVDGIGPKTAAALLQEYGTLDGIYENIGSITGKRRENLEAAREWLPRTRQLITLAVVDDMSDELERSAWRVPRPGPLLHVFRELGFNRFQAEVTALCGTDAGETEAEPEVAPAPSELVPVQGTYRCVMTRDGLKGVVADIRAAGFVAVDTETTGLERNAALCGVSLAWKPGEAVYIPVRSPSPDEHLGETEALGILAPMLADASVAKCGHNLKFDAGVLLRSGVVLRGVTFDSMLAATLLDARVNAKLDSLAATRLAARMIPITDLIGDGAEQSSMATIGLDRITGYAAEDADVALRLAENLRPEIATAGMTELVETVESPLAAVLARMEHNGIVCDPDELARQGVELQARLDGVRDDVFKAAGFEFDLNSPKQLAEALFDRLGMSAGKKTKTGRSTDVEVLEKLALDEAAGEPHTSVPRLVLEYRQLAKLIGTYLGNLQRAIDPVTGRIHTTFHQLVAATGRLASNNPNLQNIPVRTDVGRQIRKAFLAPAGSVLICADYSQIELRVLAHLSEDVGLMAAFERGEDIHASVAAQVFNVPLDSVTRQMRDSAKTINFGIVYGITSFGLARRIEGLDRTAAAELIADYKAKYPGIDAFLKRCVQQAIDEGYVTTIMRRRRYIPELRSTNVHERGLGERLAINSVVQGSAADLIKVAMVKVQDRIDRDNLPCKMLLQIHDELVFEAPEADAQQVALTVQAEMQGAMDLRVPLQASYGIGRDWYSAK